MTPLKAESIRRIGPRARKEHSMVQHPSDQSRPPEPVIESKAELQPPQRKKKSKSKAKKARPRKKPKLQTKPKQKANPKIERKRKRKRKAKTRAPATRRPT